jgi:hypothetical protein
LIGAALLGPPVASGIDWLSVAPNRTSALAESNGSQIWIPDLSAAGTSQALSRIPLAQQAFWATDASQAVILAAGAQLVWLTGFNSGPVSLSNWNLESYSRAGSTRAETARTRSPRPEAVWSLLAADSAADQVLLTLYNGEIWEIWLASSTVPPVRIPFSGHPVAAAFAPGTGGVYVADAALHQIVQIQNLRTTPVQTTLVSSEVYIKNPTAAALSADGNRLFVADGTDSVIRVFDLAGDAALLAELPSGAVPVSLTAFATDRFVVNAGIIASGQPFFFLDTGVQAKVSFVPRGQ